MLLIRPATTADAAAMLAIYAPYVRDTPITFEVDVPAQPEFEARIVKAQAGWAWLAAEADGQVIGYAYAGTHHERAAYRTSVNVSVYVHAAHRRGGVARALYAELFAVLARRGYCQAIAGITLPNDASVGLHRAMGFTPVGTYRKIGFKLGAWHDVMWLQRELRAGLPPPQVPLP
jgi:phosphinothricin acetyltransferase